jgi:hypothetical protein
MRGGLETRRAHPASQVMQLVHPITWRHRWTYSANSATTQPARSGASSVAGAFGSTVGRRNGTSVGAASGPFAETIATPFYRLHKPAELAVLVLTLLRHGGPTQAIVAAFGLDERTVARASQRAGQHCQRVHEHLVEHGQLDLQHVQANERWVKQAGAKVWMALALAVPTRRWLGGVISRQRDPAGHRGHPPGRARHPGWH